jgi:hypothetical protein
MQPIRFKLAPLAAALVVAIAAVPALAKPDDGGFQTARGAAPASVSLRSCDREAREAVFSGRMARVRGSSRMWMRFTLQERAAGADAYTRLRAPGLGRWRKSRAGVRRFVHRQRVRGLTEGSVYRTVVDFRWLDADGDVVRRARRRSRACLPSGALADLSVARITSLPAFAPGTAVYRVRLTNRGDAPARSFGVSLAVDGAVVDTQTVGRLGAHHSRSLDFTGPTCTASARAVVDPDGTVAESDETDNAHAIRCAVAR